MSDEIETIMNINDDYFVKLFVIAFVIVTLITFTKGISLYREKAKEVARTTGDKLDYGFNYIVENISVIVLGTAVTLYFVGWLISTGIVAGDTLYDCVGMTVVVAIIAGLGGDAFLRKVLESVRDKGKIAEALAPAAAEKTTEQQPVAELNKH